MNDICNHEIYITNVNKRNLTSNKVSYPDGFCNFTYILECKICKNKGQLSINSYESDYIFIYHDNLNPLQINLYHNFVYEYALRDIHDFKIKNSNIKHYVITNKKIINLNFLECKDCKIKFYHLNDMYFSIKEYNTLNCNDRIVEGILD